jgi:N-acetylglucosaminyl-diphospho-decaprenol L-rhamnosyltransferase
VSPGSNDVSAVVVDFHAGSALAHCVASLRSNGIEDIVVVENGAPGTAQGVVGDAGVTVVEPGLNLGYGRGVNRGAAATSSHPYLLVSNPDVVAHDGAVAAMVDFLESHPRVGLVGPRIERPDGTLYPSQRIFPNVWLAGLHAVLDPLWSTNPFSQTYRSPRQDGTVDWVSGALFLVRRDVFEAVGGFDERYFMFAEDMALCWQVHEAGYEVAANNEAVVTHVEGLSRAHASRAMLIAHHRSAMRFEWQSARGWRRLLAPVATMVLGLRLAALLAVRRYS